MEQTQAASSPAEAVDPFNGENLSLADYNNYRETGELPAQYKPAEPQEEAAPSDSPEETVEESEVDETETAPDSEPEEEVQEPPQKGSPAEKRIKQLLAQKKELERQLAAAKPDVKTESSPAQPQYTRPKPKAEDKNPDGTSKYSTYEDFVEELSRWNGEQLLAQYKQEQVQQQALNALKVKLDDARARYENADEVIFPTAEAINAANIPDVVKRVVADSDVFADLLFIVGEDPAELKKFISLAQSSPRAALAKVFEYERGIREEFDKSAEETKKAPEPKKTAAPKPPSPVGGGSSRAFDVSDESLTPEQWMRKRNEQVSKRK